MRKGTAAEGLALVAPVTVGRRNADGSYTLTVAELEAIQRRATSETDDYVKLTRELEGGEPVGLSHVVLGEQYYEVEVTLRPVADDDGKD